MRKIIHKLKNNNPFIIPTKSAGLNGDNVLAQNIKLPHMNQARLGSSSTPYSGSSVFEFVYDSPMLFRRVIKMFYLLKMKVLDFQCCPFEMIISGRSPEHKNSLEVVIDCSKINHWFIKEPYQFSVSTENLYAVLDNITPNYKHVYLLSSDIHKNKTLLLAFETDTHQISDEYYSVELCYNETQGEAIQQTSNPEYYDPAYIFIAQVRTLRSVFKRIAESPFHIYNDYERGVLCITYEASKLEIKNMRPKTTENKDPPPLDLDIKKGENLRLLFRAHLSKMLELFITREGIGSAVSLDNGIFSIRTFSYFMAS
jgi:hypothetical protein